MCARLSIDFDMRPIVCGVVALIISLKWRRVGFESPDWKIWEAVSRLYYAQ